MPTKELPVFGDEIERKFLNLDNQLDVLFQTINEINSNNQSVGDYEETIFSALNQINKHFDKFQKDNKIRKMEIWECIGDFLLDIRSVLKDESLWMNFINDARFPFQTTRAIQATCIADLAREFDEIRKFYILGLDKFYKLFSKLYNKIVSDYHINNFVLIIDNFKKPHFFNKLQNYSEAEIDKLKKQVLNGLKLCYSLNFSLCHPQDMHSLIKNDVTVDTMIIDNINNAQDPQDASARIDDIILKKKDKESDKTESSFQNLICSINKRLEGASEEDLPKNYYFIKELYQLQSNLYKIIQKVES